MSQLFAVVPRDGWHPGDRAYCINGSRKTKPTLEVGKVYVVANVIPMPGYAGGGLGLADVSFPGGEPGCWSTRFVKLRPGISALQQIARQTRRGWSEA